RTLQDFPAGAEAGSAGLDFGGPQRAATQPRWSFGKATPRNGWLATSARISLAGQTTISSSKGTFARISRRIAEAPPLPRTTKVPAAPMLTTSRCFRLAASCAGRKTFFPPTLAARRKTTWAIYFRRGGRRAAFLRARGFGAALRAFLRPAAIAFGRACRG